MGVINLALAIGFALSLATPASASEALPLRFPKGELQPRVASSLGADESFAVYVPPSYDAAQPAPILYLLDPRGRAIVPARLFTAAADRYGYVLVSAYNSASDGPVEPTIRAIRAMWRDAHAWFNLDDRRAYAVGFSGTVRIASTLAAQAPGSFTGIIGAGAGLASDLTLSKTTPFHFFGSVGDLDFNYSEVEDLGEKMAALDLVHRIDVFPGPHDWMPPDIAMAAVQWMQLQAIRRGVVPKDEALLNEFWKRETERARTAENAGLFLDASRRYRALARDFEGLRDVSDIVGKAELLTGSTAGRRQAQEHKDRLRHERRFLERAARTLVYRPNDELPETQAERAMADLGLSRLEKQAKSMAADGTSAKRLLNSLAVQTAFYLPRAAMARGDEDAAAFFLAIASRISPRAPMPCLFRAVIHARRGQREKALAEIEAAVDRGLADLQLVEAEKAFAPLRSDERYKAAVAAIARNAATGAN